MWWGSWWAIQVNAGFSLGVHLDWRRSVTNSGIRYGPYIDFHVARWVISLGVNPIYSGELELIQSFSRGGISAARN